MSKDYRLGDIIKTKFKGIWRTEVSGDNNSIHYYFKNSIIITKSRKNWETEVSDDNNEIIQYEFKNMDFIFTNITTGDKISGTFTFDDTNITFKIFYLNEEWSQPYMLTDEYLDLQIIESYPYGRFFKVENK